MLRTRRRNKLVNGAWSGHTQIRKVKNINWNGNK